MEFKGTFASVLPNATGAHFLCDATNFSCFAIDNNSMQIPAKHLDTRIKELLKKAYQGMIEGKEELKKPILSVNKWHGNYFHFMAETLPSLITLEGKYLYSEHKRRPFILDSTQKWSLEALKVIGHKGAIIQNLGSAIITKNPIVNVPEYLEEKSPKAICKSLKKVRSLFEPLLKEEPQPLSDRIFIERSPHKSHNGGSNRRLFPQERLRSLLENKEYSIHYLEDRRIVEQAKLFSTANHIRAVHGAALTNIIFCKKTCEIVEFVSEESPLNTIFSSIAESMGISNYKVVPCQNNFKSKEEEKNYFQKLGLSRNPSRLPLRLDKNIERHF